MYNNFNKYMAQRESQEFNQKFNILCEAISFSGILFEDYWSNVAVPTIKKSYSYSNEKELLNELCNNFYEKFDNVLEPLGISESYFKNGINEAQLCVERRPIVKIANRLTSSDIEQDEIYKEFLDQASRWAGNIAGKAATGIGNMANNLKQGAENLKQGAEKAPYFLGNLAGKTGRGIGNMANSFKQGYKYGNTPTDNDNSLNNALDQVKELKNKINTFPKNSEDSVNIASYTTKVLDQVFELLQKSIANTAMEDMKFPDEVV